jgi:hypothetical protein
LGVGGYDIHYSVERYERRGLKYNPDLVIWLMGIWDYRKINEVLQKRAQEIINETTSSGKVNDIIEKEGPYYMWLRASDEFVETQGPNLINLQYNYFERFRKIYSGKLVVAVFKDQIRGGKDENEFGTFIENIKNSDNNIYVFSDLAYQDLETLIYDGHPNKNDYLIISKKIANFLNDKKLVSCK